LDLLPAFSAIAVKFQKAVCNVLAADGCANIHEEKSQCQGRKAASNSYPYGFFTCSIAASS